ncbi:putative mitotic spindle checkpoint protein Mad2 [Helianthus anomalus]
MVNIRQLDRVGENEGTRLWLALDEVMDPQNLGAIIRPTCFLVHRGFGSVSSLAVDINEVVTGGPTILVLGSEGTGLRLLVERSCTQLVKIPDIPVHFSAGLKDVDPQSFVVVETLNVSVAAGGSNLRESFGKVKKYGLPLLLSQDEGVNTFIATLNTQLSEWLEAGNLQMIVLVIMSKDTNEVLERWNFSIETDKEVVEKGVSREKSDKEIMREIQAIMR